MDTSSKSRGRTRSALSNRTVASARPSGRRPAAPAKITSSILSARNPRVVCAPRAQATASTMLDLPEPLGPTTTDTPGSNSNRVRSAKDLKPAMLKDLRCNLTPALSGVLTPM